MPKREFKSKTGNLPKREFKSKTGKSAEREFKKPKREIGLKGNLTRASIKCLRQRSENIEIRASGS